MLLKVSVACCSVLLRGKVLCLSVGFCRGLRVTCRGLRSCGLYLLGQDSLIFLVFTWRQEKLKLKTLSFHLHQVEVSFKTKYNICWPVFSLVGYFVLKIYHGVFPQCVTCVTLALFLGNMLRIRKYLFAFICARKYRFALCFQVLSNLYVERSAYANVFKFNREKKHFERAKVNSRCFHWFPAAMFILNTIIFSDILCQITLVPNIVHPQNFGMLFIYYSSTIFEFPDVIYWMVSDFIFHLCDNQAYLRDVKTANTCFYWNCFVLTDILLAISDELKLIVSKFTFPLYCLFLLSLFLGVLLFALFWVLSVQNNMV